MGIISPVPIDDVNLEIILHGLLFCLLLISVGPQISVHA